MNSKPRWPALCCRSALTAGAKFFQVFMAGTASGIIHPSDTIPTQSVAYQVPPLLLLVLVVPTNLHAWTFFIPPGKVVQAFQRLFCNHISAS